ncbi:MAG: hypothetical protein JKY43_06050 [Phycisphaerales bacterium]|nr:hypothetical protein [Phycisphaerales bacterium]
MAIYSPLAESWRVYDNSGLSPEIVAMGSGVAAVQIADRAKWQQFTTHHGTGGKNDE